MEVCGNTYICNKLTVRVVAIEKLTIRYIFQKSNLCGLQLAYHDMLNDQYATNLV